MQSSNSKYFNLYRDVLCFKRIDSLKIFQCIFLPECEQNHIYKVLSREVSQVSQQGGNG